MVLDGDLEHDASSGPNTSKARSHKRRAQCFRDGSVNAFGICASGVSRYNGLSDPAYSPYKFIVKASRFFSGVYS